jgi:HEAT repeat protein
MVRIRRALTERLGDSDEEVRGEAMVGLSRRGDLAVVDHIVRELDGEPGGLAVDAAEEILELHPGEPRITAALARMRQGPNY